MGDLLNLEIPQIYVDYARDLQSLDVIDIMKTNESLILDLFLSSDFIQFLKDYCFCACGQSFYTWITINDSDREVKICDIVQIYYLCPKEYKLLMRNLFYLIIKHFHGADFANSFADECLDCLYFV